MKQQAPSAAGPRTLELRPSAGAFIRTAVQRDLFEDAVAAGLQASGRGPERAIH